MICASKSRLCGRRDRDRDVDGSVVNLSEQETEKEAKRIDKITSNKRK